MPVPVWVAAVAWLCAAYESTVVGVRPDAVADGAADASVITDARTPRAGEDVPQLLAELPGVSVVRLGNVGSVALVSLRGSAWDQVNIYLDGVLLNSALGGGVDLGAIVLADVARVEVFRGVTPIAFGQSNIGGVVAITTRAPQRSGVRATAGAGSFGYYALDAAGAYVFGDYISYASVHGLSSAGNFPYVSDNGTVFATHDDSRLTRANNAVLEGSVTLRAQAPVGPGNLVAAAWLFDRAQGLPGHGTRPTHSAHLRSRRLIGQLAYSDASGLLLRLDANLEQQEFADLKAEIGAIPASTRDSSRSLGAHAQRSWTLHDTTVVSATLETRWDNVVSRDLLASSESPASQRWFAGLAAQMDFYWAWARLHIVPVLRLEINRDDRAGRDAFTKLVNRTTPVTQVLPGARLGVRKRWLWGSVLRANVGRYARIPSLSELYGDSGFGLGNTQLTSETGYNADAGFVWTAAMSQLTLTTQLTAFGSLTRNLIQYQQNAYGQARPFNIGQARILGADGSLEAALGHADKSVRFVGQLTFMDARDVSASALGRLEPLLPLRPRWSAYSRAEARLAVRDPVQVGAFVDFNFVGANALDSANLVFLPARKIVTAGVFASFLPACLEAAVTLQNITDVHAFDVIGFPLPGRSIFASLRFNNLGEDCP